MSRRYPFVSPADVAGNIPGRNRYKPTGVIAESCNRSEASLVNLAAALTSQVLSLKSIFLKKGDVISSATFYSGGTAAGTPTNQWAVLVDDPTSRTVLAVSADATTAAWAANTAKTFTYGSAYTVPADGHYYVGLMVKATTVPSLIGISDGYNDINGLTPILSATAGSGLTTPPLVGSTVGAFAASVRRPYVTVA